MIALQPTAPHNPRIRSDYLSKAVDTRALQATINRSVEFLKQVSFDAIAFRGMSGALVSPLLAVTLGKSLVMVRKPGEGSHSAYKVEGDYCARTYVIVDDFLQSGATAQAIMDEVKTFAPDAQCVGVLEYDNIGELGYLKGNTHKTLPNEDRLLRLVVPGVIFTREEIIDLCLRYPLS